MTLSVNANAGAFLLFVVASILAVSTTSYAALNITKALEKNPEYSTLNELFKETKLTGAINKRQTITILALDNDSIKLIASRSSDEIRKILMNHVILDYYDKQKIKKMKKSILLTTLYQTTGSANDKEGFVNITKIKSGEVVFGSGVKKAPLVSKLLGSVITQPFNLSVLHVSLPIVAPSFGEAIEAPPPPPGGSSKSSGDDKKSKSDSGDAPSPSDDEEGVEEEADSPSPSDAPAEAPEEDKAKSPAKKKDAADEEDDKASASSRVVRSRVGVAAVIGLVTTLVAF